jgi:hypothetical protein
MIPGNPDDLLTIDRNLKFPFLRHLKQGPICDVKISFLYTLPDPEFLDISSVRYSVDDEDEDDPVSCPFPRLKDLPDSSLILSAAPPLAL